MSCQTKPGVKPFLDYIKATTGQKITQADWHDIRQLATEEHVVAWTSENEHGIRFGDKLPKSRATEAQVITSIENLKTSLGEDASFPMATRLQGQNVTQGTLYAINYLTQNGVKETLDKVSSARLAKKKNSQLDSDGQRHLGSNPIPEGWNFSWDADEYIAVMKAPSGWVDYMLTSEESLQIWWVESTASGTGTALISDAVARTGAKQIAWGDCSDSGLALACSWHRSNPDGPRGVYADEYGMDIPVPEHPPVNIENRE